MSFAVEVKKELCNLPVNKASKLKAECYGLMLFAKNFSEKKISFTTENNFLADHYIKLTTELFNPIIEKRSYVKNKKTNKKLYTVEIIDERDCKKIFESFGHNKSELNLRFNRGNLEDDNSTPYFIKGAFLSCGSVNDPNKNYHLEFCVPYKTLCKDLCTMLGEIIRPYKIAPKIVERKGVFVAYIKNSEQITDLLTYMGAFKASMSIMSAKAIKQVRNVVNRRTNSEIANIKRTADASVRQINAIKKIKSKDKFKNLTVELQEIANIRLENPELSLRDLGKLMSPEMKRSSVNYRINKILEFAEEL